MSVLQQHTAASMGGKRLGVDSSADEDDSTLKKRRKVPYYLAQKEKKAALRREVHALQSHVYALKQRAAGANFNARLRQKAAENALLQEIIHSQKLVMASAQAAVASILVRLHNWFERQRALQEMKDAKLRSAIDYIERRTFFLGPLKSYHSTERSCDANGNCVSVCLDVTHFENVTSLRQVFDAIFDLFCNIEVNISERLGHVIVREDVNFDDESVANYRIVSTSPGCGPSMESNCALFSQFFEPGEDLARSGDVCGLVMVDFADDDALYPYRPHERIRKDVTATYQLTPHVKQTPTGDVLVVRVVRTETLKLHYPQFDVDDEILQGLRDNMGWSAAVAKILRDTLAKQSALCKLAAKQNGAS